MKIQCDCGAKYAFDASPEMVRNPIAFACPTCGADLSPQLNALVRQEFGNVMGPVGLSVAPSVSAAPRAGLAPATEIAPPPPGAAVPTPSSPLPPRPVISINSPAPAPAPAPVSTPAPPPMRISIGGTTPPAPAAAPVSAPPPPVPPSIRINLPSPATASAEAPPPVPVPSIPQPPPVPVGKPAVRLSHGAASAAAAATPDVKDARFCSKHPQQRVTEKCRVCQKPICPSCMQLFGYVCSPHCKEKAELQGIELPKFAGQRDEMQRKEWRKIGLVVKLAALFILSAVGVWIWYAWFGSTPRPAFAVRFEDEPAMSGSSAFCDNNQVVFLHGAKLARYDLKAKKQVWLRNVVDKKAIEAEAAKDIKEMQEEAAKSEFPFKVPDLGKWTKQMIENAERSQELRVLGHNIWVAGGGKVRRFDWDTGEPKQEVEFSGDFADGVLRGDELEFKEQVGTARMSVTRFSLASGKVQVDEIGEKPKPTAASMAALLSSAGGGKGKPAPGNVRGMSPQQLAAAVANAPLAAKLAAPATISVARNQQAALDVMDEMDGELDGALAAHTGRGITGLEDDDAVLFRENSTIIPTAKGFLQMTSQMTEKNIVARSAAKAPPKKSALDGPVNAAATMDIANELLNEMSRNAGGDIVKENRSKYKVKLHLGGGPEVPDFEVEVIGEPEIYPQPTVNVLAAGTNIIVLDHQNKKKWERTLVYPISGGGSYFEMDEASQRGLGPVVERGDTLYVYDQGVLSAFETATGTARWRLPSVGINGMFFDDAGMIYLNTTTASPDKIKYSRQIDVNDNTGDIVLKLNPKNGQEIWKHSMGGNIAYLSGKFIYTLSYTPPRDDDEERDENLAALGLDSNRYLRIRRISPKNGRVMWDHFQPRGALDVQIHDNMFFVIFKKEVQVLKFLSF